MFSNVFSYDGFLKYFKNTSWMIMEKIIRLGVGIWIGAWSARYLGPENFGILSYAQSLVFLLGAIASLGLDGILVRELINDRLTQSELLGTSFWLKLGGATLQFLLLIPLSRFSSNDSLTSTIIIITACSVFFQTGWVIDSFFQSKVQSKYSAIANSLVFFFSSGIKIILLISNASLAWFASTAVFESGLLSLMLFLLYRSKGFDVTKWHFNPATAVFLLRESWPLIISSLVVSLYMRIDQIMIKEMINVEAVGHYAAAIRISEAWYFLPMQIAASLFPAIVSARKKSVTLYRKRISKLYSLLIWLSITIAIATQIFGKSFINFLFGQTYAQAGAVLVFHIWAGIFVSIGVVNSQWFLSRNQQATGALMTVFGAITNIILNFVLIGPFGIIGAAAATTISYAGAALIFPMFHPRTKELFFVISRSFILRSR